jgi:hypothetical protein
MFYCCCCGAGIFIVILVLFAPVLSSRISAGQRQERDIDDWGEVGRCQK